MALRQYLGGSNYMIRQSRSRLADKIEMISWRLFAILVILPGIMIPCIAGAATTVHTRTTPLESVPAVGDLPYHNGSTLICSDCHVTHSSQTHDYQGSQGSGQQTASEMLLKASGVNELCLSCHDGKAGIPDVVSADTNGLANRSAGMFEGIGIDSWKGHSLASGKRSGSACNQCHSTGKAQLQCTDCHSPHGNGRPRNLQWASKPGSEPQFGLLVDPAATGLAKYESENVAYATNDTDMLREISNMCVDCHHDLSGQNAVKTSGAGGHIRHPSYDSERQSTNNIAQGESTGSSSPQHWLAGSGIGFEIERVRFVTSGAQDFASAKNVASSRNGVFCLTCHKAHGSTHAFGMTWDVSNKTSSTKGCSQCHGM